MWSKCGVNVEGEGYEQALSMADPPKMAILHVFLMGVQHRIHLIMVLILV